MWYQQPKQDLKVISGALENTKQANNTNLLLLISMLWHKMRNKLALYNIYLV